MWGKERSFLWMLHIANSSFFGLNNKKLWALGGSSIVFYESTVRSMYSCMEWIAQSPENMQVKNMCICIYKYIYEAESIFLHTLHFYSIKVNSQSPAAFRLLVHFSRGYTSLWLCKTQHVTYLFALINHLKRSGRRAKVPPQNIWNNFLQTKQCMKSSWSQRICLKFKLFRELQLFCVQKTEMGLVWLRNAFQLSTKIHWKGICWTMTQHVCSSLSFLIISAKHLAVWDKTLVIT